MELRNESRRAVDYLAFRLARRDFLIAAGKVRGILPAGQLVPARHPTPWVCGVAGVLGRQCPVIDLRVKLGMPEALRGRRPVVVVVEAPATGADLPLVGFLADKASTILHLREAEFRNDRTRVNGRLRRRIDLGRLLTASELAMLEHVTLYAIGIRTAV